MKAMIFGRTGQVARELARSVPSHVDARFLDRSAANFLDPASCVRWIGPDIDVVINAAAFTQVDAAERQVDAAFAVNAVTPGEIGKACKAAGVPMVHISTDYVFDGTGTEAWAPHAKASPLNVYGQSKLAGEEAVRGSGAAHVILRTSWVVSDSGPNFLQSMVQLASETNRIRVVSDQIGGLTPAGALARAIWQIADELTCSGDVTQTHHFAGWPDASWADIARSLFQVAGWEITVEDVSSSDYQTAAKRPLNSRLDCRSLETQFGIPRPDWRGELPTILREVAA